MIDVVDGQVHLPRLVTDWREGHPRVSEVDAPDSSAPTSAAIEPPPFDTTLAGTLTAMDAAGINGLVIDEWLGLDEAGYMAPNVQLEDGVRRYTFEFSEYAAERYPERFTWLARVNPEDRGLDDVIDELARRPGMRCLRVNPLPWLGHTERFRAGEYTQIFEAARRNDLPVFVWSNGPHLSALEQYLERFADLRFVLDHLGTIPPKADMAAIDRFSGFEAVFELGRRFENLSIKWSTTESTSGQIYPYRDVVPYLIRAIEIFGPRRIMWASDWTQHKIQQTWAQGYSWILDTNEVATDDKEWILGRTARTILDWPAVDGAGVGEGVYVDCSMGHPSIRVSGINNAEYLAAMRRHLAAWHPRHQASDTQLLGLGRR